MALKTNSFEGGTDNTGITTGNSGGASGTAFSGVTLGTTGTANFETTGAFAGSLCGEFTQATDANSLNVHWTDTSAADFAVRFYFKISSLPTAEVQFPVLARTSADSHQIRGQLTTAGMLRFLNQAGGLIGATTTALSTATWYRGEMQVTATGGSAGTFAWQTYLGNGPTPISGTSLTATSVVTTGTIGLIRYGKASAAGLGVWQLDDMAQNIGDATPIGPVGGLGSWVTDYSVIIG